MTLLLALLACAPTDAPADTPAPWVVDGPPLTPLVDPMFGTKGSGNVIPGALVPHGMVRASPDTRSPPGSIDAYDWDDALLEGFTHTHLEGPGGSANGYSQVLVLPQTGELVLDPDDRDVPIDHARERAAVGRYELDLDAASVALTATSHAAIHRYTFPAGPARLLIDLGHSNGISTGGRVQIDGGHLSGFGEYNVHPAASTLSRDGETAITVVYVDLAVDVPPTDAGTFKGREPEPTGALTASGAWVGGWLGWTFDAPTTVEVRVGISYVDEAQAARNAREELGDRSFDAVVAAAEEAWQQVLARVQVEADDTTKRLFYSALYHAAFQPADHTEPGNVTVVGSSGELVVREGLPYRYFTDDWCLWDTFRTSHPLGSLLEPELRDDIASSLLLHHQEGGWLDKCTWSATGYSRVMIGNHGVPILVDAWRRGLRGFDAELAWEAIDHVGTAEIDPLPDGICGYVNMGTPPDYLANGWVPIECDPFQSASMTLEHAYDDAVAGWFAADLGRADDAARYAERGTYWRNHLDPDTRFMRGRYRDGSWRDPFDPAGPINEADFSESNSWTYTFFVPQDVPGLVEALGGPEAFHARLDAYFDGGFYDPTNQPSFHIPWLYAHAGDPAGTQRRVREALDAHFRMSNDGLPGNDDAGAMSAWLVLAMLGLYPVTPGDPVWTLGAPRVQEATIHLHPGHYDGGTFTIRAVGDPATEAYVAGVTLDGEVIDRPWITHDEIAGGGVLEVTLSATPTAWGAGVVW